MPLSKKEADKAKVLVSDILTRAGGKGADADEVRKAAEKEIGAKLIGPDFGRVLFGAGAARVGNKYYPRGQQPRPIEATSNGTGPNATVQFEGDLTVTVNGAGMPFKHKKAKKVIIVLASLIVASFFLLQAFPLP